LLGLPLLRTFRRLACLGCWLRSAGRVRRRSRIPLNKRWGGWLRDGISRFSMAHLGNADLDKLFATPGPTTHRIGNLWGGAGSTPTAIHPVQRPLGAVDGSLALRCICELANPDWLGEAGVANVKARGNRPRSRLRTPDDRQDALSPRARGKGVVDYCYVAAAALADTHPLVRPALPEGFSALGARDRKGRSLDSSILHHPPAERFP